MKDYYKVMGLSREATGEEIKKAYRTLALRYHPDRNQGDPVCEHRLKEVNEAYQNLRDEDKRRQYDLLSRRFFDTPVCDPQEPGDELIKTLWAFACDAPVGRGFGGCRGMGLGRKGCRRWMRNF